MSNGKFFVIPNGSSGIFRDDLGFNGRNSDPNTAHIKTVTDKTSIVLRQPNSLMHNAISGAKINVPRPDPATAIPVESESAMKMNQIHLIDIQIHLPIAMERYFSKYMDTLTIAYAVN